jgi:hypothetical protein
MPYEGKSVSIEEMLDILISSGLSEASAVVQLQRAMEDKALVMLVPDGSNEDGEEMWCDLSPIGRSACVAALHQWRDREESPLTPQSKKMIRGIRAVRFQFEGLFGIRQSEQPTTASEMPLSRDKAVLACIESGMIPASTATWDAFCERVRDLADGWADKKNGALKRGFDEKTIKRDVAKVMN